MGGTMRLGIYPCRVAENSWAARAYDAPVVQERHRHRFELNNAYKEALGDAGLRATGLSPDGSLVEIMEMDGHDFMVGVQFHPEFLSRPGRPHPLFREFVGVAMDTLREGGQHEMPLEESENAPVASGLAKAGGGSMNVLSPRQDAAVSGIATSLPLTDTIASATDS